MINQKFNRLIVLERAKDKKGFWICKCDCGKMAVVRKDRIKSGKTKSCGCLRREHLLRINLKHGCSKKGKRTKEFEAWRNAKYYAKTHGIFFEKSWADFSTFLKDLGEVKKGETLGRRNRKEGYTRRNCHWRDEDSF